MKLWIMGILIGFSAAAFADLAWLRYEVAEIRFTTRVDIHCRLRSKGVDGQAASEIVLDSGVAATIKWRLNDQLARTAGHRIEFDGFQNARILCREKDPVPVPEPGPATE